MKYKKKLIFYKKNLRYEFCFRKNNDICSRKHVVLLNKNYYEEF